MSEQIIDATARLRNRSGVRVAGSLATVLLSVVGGCVRSPTVEIRNETRRTLHGFIQIPLVSTVGYPPPGSRERFAIPSMQQAQFRHQSDSPVQAYGLRVHLGILQDDGDFQVAAIELERERRLSLIVRTRGQGWLIEDGGGAPVRLLPMRHDEVDAMLGKPLKP